MKEVTEAEFFKRIEPLDVHPNHDRHDHTDWRMRHNRLLIGRTFPGWKNPGDTKSYWLTEAVTT